MVDQGLVHTYTDIFTPLFEKNKNIYLVHVKTQKHAMNHCQEHAKPTGGDITLTVKPCWPIRSLKNVRTDFTGQNLQFHQLHNNTATGVSENLHPGRSFQKCFKCVCMWKKWPKRIKIAAVLKIPVFVWRGAQDSANNNLNFSMFLTQNYHTGLKHSHGLFLKLENPWLHWRKQFRHASELLHWCSMEDQTSYSFGMT